MPDTKRAWAFMAVLCLLGGCDDAPSRGQEGPSRGQQGHETPRAATSSAETSEAQDIEESYRAPVQRIVAASDDADFAWEWLRTLCVDIGHRLSGSASLERATVWAATELEGIEGARVFRQEVEVPAWVRGEESLTLLGAEEESLAMIGLGGSVGTVAAGVEGEVVVLASLDEIDSRADELEGRVVLLNQPMPAYDAAALETGYGATVSIRTRGAARAVAHGALAVLVRSVTTDADSPPHTGATRYEEGAPRIPAAAVTIPVAERLAAMVAAGEHPRVRLRMEAEDQGTRTSHNVIAELRGTELPDEIVVFGGHIDSWDVGQGCHDDGAGVVSAMAALRLLKELDMRPRRTLRVVLWTNEENGLRGAHAYDEAHFGDGLHVAAIESDIGAARVIGLQVQTEEVRREDAVAQLRSIANLLEPIGVRVARAGFGGADAIPLRERGVPSVGILHDPAHYFDLHHTAADTFEAVDHDEFLQGVAVMTATAYVIADMQPRLSNPR